MPAWMPPARLALAAGAGACLWLSFPAPGLWPLAIAGVALLALATRGVPARYGALLGFVCGLVFFLPLLRWSGIYVGATPWGALCVLEALYLALLGWASALVQRATSLAGQGRVRPVALAVLWVATEALRATTPFGGFPWARLAFSQADGPLARLAALAGAPAVTFGVAVVGGTLAAGVSRVWRTSVTTTPHRDPHPSLAGRQPHRIPVRVSRLVRFVPGAALAAVLLGLPLLVDLPVRGRPVQVMAVQGNVARPGLEFNQERRAVLDNHARVTAAAAQQVREGSRPRPDLVVWPENSADIDPLRNPDAEAVITRARDDVGAPLLLGAVLEEPLPRLSNAALLYRPGSVGVQQRYLKQHPVPFAEYMPYRSFFRLFSDKVDLLRTDFAPGHGAGVFRLPVAAGGRLAAGTVICFEVAYDGLVRDAVRSGANLLVVQTNNATFGYSDESVQQLAISRLRAIEHGRAVVHVSTVGVSALIGPDGTVLHRSRLFTAAALSAALPMRDELTPADRVGPWPERLAGLLAGVLVLAAVRGRRQDRPAGMVGSPSPRTGAADRTKDADERSSTPARG
ncbi:MAG TPA: apolipoprotein N-acyltransferase [Dermatophilaceae bacterium]|nr:apolipoprotein N-acyltransferase [Dermatophilaceae bacterium]